MRLFKRRTDGDKMSIYFFITICAICIVKEKLILIEASENILPGAIVNPLPENRADVVNQFQDYMPVLKKIWEKYGQHREVMTSAMGCAKLAIFYPFLTTSRLIFLAIGYGLDADAIKYFIEVYNKQQQMNRSDATTADTNTSKEEVLSDEVYQKMVEFNKLAQSINGSSADISQVVEETDSTLTSIFYRVLSGTNRFSKFALYELSQSLRSCYTMFVQIKNSKEFQQDFIDAIKMISTSEKVRNVSKSAVYIIKDQLSALLNNLSNYAMEKPEPTVDDETKMKKLDLVVAETKENYSKQSLTNSSTGWFGLFSGNKADDPFKHLIKYPDDEIIQT